MPPKGYKSVSFPEILMEKIEKLIENKKHGYRNPTEFIIDAVRIKLRHEETRLKKSKK